MTIFIIFQIVFDIFVIFYMWVIYYCLRLGAKTSSKQNKIILLYGKIANTGKFSSSQMIRALEELSERISLLEKKESTNGQRNKNSN